MKKLFAVLLVLVTGLAYAEESVFLGNAQQPAVSCSVSGVNVAPETMAKYPSQVMEVFRDKGKVVTVVGKTESHFVSLFHYKEQAVQIVGVKYYSTSNMIATTMEKVVLTENIHFSPLAILFIIGALVMIALDGFIARGKLENANKAVIAVMVILIAILAAAAFASLTVGLLFLSTVLAATLSFVVFILAGMFALSVESLKRAYLAVSVVLCVAWFAMAWSVYSPLF